MADALAIDSWKNPLTPTDAKTTLAPTPDAAPAKPDEPTKAPEKGGMAAASADIGKGAEEANRKISAYEAEAGKLTPPQLKPVPPPTPKVTDPIEVFGSAAMIFAGLGSMLSRRHMTTALNAATAVMNSFKANDAAATEQAYKVWQAETQNALQVADFQSKAYNAAMGNLTRKEGIAEREGAARDKAAEARVKALTFAFSDPLMAQELERGGIAAAAEFQKAREKKVEDAAKAAQEIEPKYQAARAMKEAMADPAWATSDNQGKADLLLKYGHPEAVKAMGKRSASNLDRPLTDGEQARVSQIIALAAPYPRGNNPTDVRIRQGVAEQAGPDFAASDYGNTSRIKMHWMDPQFKPAAQLASVDRAAQHLDVLKEAYDKLGNVDPQRANAVINWAKTQFGDAAVTGLDAARQIVMNEIVKATSGVAGTGEDRDKAQSLMSEKLSPAQAAEAMEVMGKLITGSLEVSKQQYLAGTKSQDKPEEFDKLVSERTRRKFLHQNAGGKTEPASEKKPEAKEPPNKSEAPPAEAIETLRKNKDDPKFRQSFIKHFGEAALTQALGE